MIARFLTLVAAATAIASSPPVAAQAGAERCEAYDDFLRPLAQPFRGGPDRGQYGVRHALPALATYSARRDPALAYGIKATLRSWGRWVDGEIAAKRGVHSFEGLSLLALYRRELREGGDWTGDDERWFDDRIRAIRANWYGLKPGDGAQWRGSQHRGMAAATNNLLAAALLPRDRGSNGWRARGETVWNDWWRYRDIGINDIHYFSDSLGLAIRTADLLGRDEVFTDAAAQNIMWDRLVHETAPDGALIPYGVSGGWHGLAGVRIMALEHAAAKTRDPRYAFVARKLFDYARANGGFSPGQAHYEGLSIEALAEAAIACDADIGERAPDAGSLRLDRPEIVRLRGNQPGGVFDAMMDQRERLLPSKLTLRSGWNANDMYMLVEAYARHDPLNPTAILGFTAGGAALTETVSQRDVARANAVALRPQGRSAQVPVGYAGMESRIESFGDDSLASHARIAVENYQGLDAEQTREILFVKNRFALVRDETVLGARFNGSIGPQWYTQTITGSGRDWFAGRIDNHWYNGDVRLYRNRPVQLLHVFGSGTPARLDLTAATVPGVADSDQLASLRHFRLARRDWSGTAGPGTRLQFAQLMLPLAPDADPARAAGRVTVLRDTPGMAAVGIAGARQWELVVLNESGERFRFDTPHGAVESDARALYLELGDGTARYSARGASRLTVDGRTVFSGARDDRVSP